MNTYINTDLIWTLPTRSFIIMQRVISFNKSVPPDSLNSTQANASKNTFKAVPTFQYLGDVIENLVVL